MDNKTTAVPSARWWPLEYDEHGGHWTARMRYAVTEREHAAGIDPVVYGPTDDACVRETVRMDRLWVLFPTRAGKDEAARERARFLASGPTA